MSSLISISVFQYLQVGHGDCETMLPHVAETPDIQTIVWRFSNAALEPADVISSYQNNSSTQLHSLSYEQLELNRVINSNRLLLMLI